MSGIGISRRSWSLSTARSVGSVFEFCAIPPPSTYLSPQPPLSFLLPRATTGHRGTHNTGGIVWGSDCEVVWGGLGCGARAFWTGDHAPPVALSCERNGLLGTPPWPQTPAGVLRWLGARGPDEGAFEVSCARFPEAGRAAFLHGSRGTRGRGPNMAAQRKGDGSVRSSEHGQPLTIPRRWDKSSSAMMS